MKIIILKDSLVNALQLLLSITSRTTTESIINQVFIQANKETNLVSFKATNFEVSFLGEFEAEIIEAGATCINAGKLYNLVKEFLSNQIEIVSTEQNWVHIRGGNSNIKLPGMETENFPSINFEELEKSFYLPCSTLKKVIDRTYFSIGENPARKNLMGLNFKVMDSNKIRWLGADGFRITQMMVELEEPVNFEGNIIIPKKSLLELKKILDYSNEEMVQISFNENQFQVSTDQLWFETKLIDKEYPNLESIIISSGEYIANVNRKEMVNAVKIISMINEDKGSSVKLTYGERKIVLESEKLGAGEGENTINTDYSGKEISIGFNIRFFLEALQIFDSSEVDTLSITSLDSQLPLLIECEEWDDYKNIIMPMRLRW